MLLLLTACALFHADRPSVVRVEPEGARVADAAWVRRRPGEPLPALGPDARIDVGLRAAAEELAAGATSADARLTPGAIRTALGRAGYPGEVRLVRAVGGAEVPPGLLDALPRNAPLDVGWAWRDLGDGRRWWVLAWSLRTAAMDPVRRDLAVDEGFALRVDGAKDPRLYIGDPDGFVRELAITPSVARWVDVFHVPGEYRVEVIDGDAVDLLFSVYVDASVPPAAPLPGAAPVPDPEEAARLLTERLAALRARAGLPALRPFPDFVPLVRAHATCIASLGVAVHASPSCPGVADLASRLYHPRARHHEDIAVGDTAEEAWERLTSSPAHLQNLLCTTCTHVAVATAREPASPPRLFAVWELLELPDGTPRAIEPAR